MREWRKGWHDVGETISLIGTKIHIVTDGAKTHKMAAPRWMPPPIRPARAKVDTPHQGHAWAEGVQAA